MSTILSVTTQNSSVAFALKLHPDDDPSKLKERCATKLDLEIPNGLRGMKLKYEWMGVWYGLDDDDDFSLFLYRVRPPSSPPIREVPILLSSPLLTPISPQQPNVDSASVSSLRSPKHPFRSDRERDVSLHVVDSSSLEPKEDTGSMKSGKTGRSKKSKHRSGEGIDGNADEVEDPRPAHKIAFEKFHNQQGVRTLIGSVGPVHNVRMMMKPGHRHVYMSRDFAQQHDFIPKDAAPGFYGFAGITNLGSWPITVGSRTVQLQVQLIEKSYFPIILGRSFMEKRGVKTTDVDPTSVVFLDTNEVIECDIVIVKDSNGGVVPIS